MKKKTIKIPIYQGKLIIIYDKNLSYFSKKYNTKDLKDYGAVTTRIEHGKYAVAFEYNEGSIIAHEIVHIVNYIFEDCGIHLDRINDEAQAYLTGWLFKEIEKFLNDNLHN